MSRRRPETADRTENDGLDGGRTLRQGFLALGDAPQTAGPPVEVPRPDPTLPAAPPSDRPTPSRQASPCPPEPPPQPPPHGRPPAPRPRDAVQNPVRSAKPPVTFRSQSTGSDTLTGTTRTGPARDEAAPGRGTQQRTGTILRIAAPRATSPRAGHRAELRVAIFFDGADIVRYGVYRDPDSLQGFDGSGRVASFSVRVREEHVVPAGPSNVGSVQLRYEGRVAAGERGELRFEGEARLDGRGTVSASPPRITGGTGRAALRDGVPCVGWW